MPNDFTPTVIPIVRAKMLDIFKTGATVNPELTNIPVTQQALLTKQTANVSPLMDAAGNMCVGLRAWYNVADVTALPTSSTTAIASNCDLTTGDGLSTLTQDYNLNYFQKPSIFINDKDCDNFSKFTDRLAFLLAHKMSLMAQQLNTDLINDLEANKSVVSATNLPDGVTAGADYTITGAAFWSGIGAADTLAILDQLARIKGLPNNYYIISGKALRVSKDQAADHSVNDNERSYAVSFAKREMFNDEDFLDPTIGAEAIYLVDPNAFVGYFHSEYPAAGENTGDENNTVNFSVPFQYYDMYQDGSFNLRTIQYANNGVLQDARIDIRYQKKCNATDNKYGKPSLNHYWELDLGALLDFIPVEGDNTGIIKVLKA